MQDTPHTPPLLHGGIALRWLVWWPSEGVFAGRRTCSVGTGIAGSVIVDGIASEDRGRIGVLNRHRRPYIRP
jgi:hypothetical protein